jgi:hypothetical protein
MTKFVLVGTLLLAAAGFADLTSVLQTGDFQLTVDSIEVRGGTMAEMVVTPNFGGEPNTEDTFNFDPRVEWPDRGVVLYYSDAGGGQFTHELPDVREDEYYELPMFDGPAQIKFLRSGAVGEGARVAAPVRVSVAPNPLVTSSAVRLAVRRAGDLRVEVYDGTGQVVRVLSSGRAAPGHVVLNWDGADSAGVRVSTGVYFVRAALDGSRSLAKVVVTE